MMVLRNENNFKGYGGLIVMSPEPELLLRFAHVRSQVLMERMGTDDGSSDTTGAIF